MSVAIARSVAPIGQALGRDFYRRSAPALARAMLGRLLVHECGGLVSGRVVEVEAYRGALDAASHAYRGRTARNAVMFGPPGHAYVYFTYGMHHCLNLVAGRDGVAEAVLVRALEPEYGVERMRERRGGVADVARLARGPGCVAQALGIAREHDGADLVAGCLWLSDLPARRDGHRIAAGPRIGITRAVERAWRFYLAGNSCVSAPRGARLGAGASGTRRPRPGVSG